MDVSNACTDEISNNLHDANAENLSDAMIQEIPQLNSANSSTIMQMQKIQNQIQLKTVLVLMTFQILARQLHPLK